jgi:SAM-dependent methyltransferase
MHTCPLCHNTTDSLTEYRDNRFFICDECGLYFRDPEHLIEGRKEKERYEMHNNDVYDPGYRKFVSPIVNNVLSDMRPSDLGLDFGAGTGPVISKMLEEKGYAIVQYDPFFHPYPHLLETVYDYIVCCEVIEHFHHPDMEFERLRRLLKDGGKLYCMTGIYHTDVDFNLWTYKNDPTHVSIYQERTLNWIADRHRFSDVYIGERLIIFTT